MNKPDDVSAEAWEIAKDIEFDFECDWTADGRRVGEIERNSAIASIARAIDAAIAKERERCAMVADEYDGDGLTGGYDMHLGDAHLTKHEIAKAIRNPSKP